MELMKTKHKVRCDFSGCNNFAEFSLKTKGLLKGEMFFCMSCANQMYSEFNKLFVPKAIQSPYKNPRKIRRKNEN